MAEENKDDQNSLMPKKYKTAASDVDVLEKEVEELDKQRESQQDQGQDENENPDQDKNNPELSAEERTYAKRYSDLRRYQQQEKERLENRISELEQQLKQSSQKDMELPTTKEELEAWANKYPDLYNIIQAVADDRAQQRDSQLDDRLKSVEERERHAAMQQALQEIRQAHPDFDNLRSSDEFHEWAETQRPWVQQALYENETDAQSVIDVIDLYKARNKKNTGQKSKQAERDAASPVKTSQRQEEPAQENSYKFRESELANMNPAEFEKRLEEIEKAQREGKIYYDLSGERQAAS